MGYRPGGGLGGVVLGRRCSSSSAPGAISWIFAFFGVDRAHARRACRASRCSILFPLTFMSNAFVPIDTMPGWLQAGS